jgi:hypothetical protein
MKSLCTIKINKKEKVCLKINDFPSNISGEMA